MQKSQNEDIKPKLNTSLAKKNILLGLPKISKLKFRATEQLPISTRDYGLMRSTNRSSTPFPRAQPGIDATLLKARLTMRRDYERRRTSSNTSVKLDQSPSFSDMDSQHSSINNAKVNVFRRFSQAKETYKEMLSVGTPHPNKGVALNAKMLARRLTDINEQLKLPPDPKPANPPVRTMKSKKKKVLLSTAVHNFDSPPHEEDSPPIGEMVSKRLSSRLTKMDFDASESSSSLNLKKPLLSFAERRRLFNEGEFTIAKQGRKMSNVMMASPMESYEFSDKSAHFAQKAKMEMEKYMKSQGLIKISNNQVTMTRLLSRGSELTSPSGSIINTNKDQKPVSYKDFR